VEGYPGGGSFTVSAAMVLDSFQATGRNIYNEGATDRQVYSLKTDVRPGNSGGPLINKDGTVIGVVFAESTTYDHVGYALTMQQVISEFHQADTNTQPVSTGTCAE
jgi:S1-C subfamily serine protease